ncbi:MAG: ABC transporter permease [Patescibacteria group bacterium]
MKEYLWHLLIFCFAMLFWLMLFYGRVFNELLLPEPLIVLRELSELLVMKYFWLDFVYSVGRALLGFTIGGAAGVMLGFLFPVYSPAGRALRPWIDFLRSIPGPSLVPIFMLFFGLTESSKILYISFIVALIVIVGAINGTENANSTRRLFIRSLSMSRTRMFFHYILPEALPYISASAKIGLSYSFVATVVAEMLMSTEYGFGRRIIEYQMVYETAKMYATILIIGLFGYLANQGYLSLEKRWVHWAGK